MRVYIYIVIHTLFKISYIKTNVSRSLLLQSVVFKVHTSVQENYYSVHRTHGVHEICFGVLHRVRARQAKSVFLKKIEKRQAKSVFF